MKRILLIAWFLLTALAVAPATAQGTTFELGGQILGFLHPAEMRTAGMTGLKMQITYTRGGTTADAQNVINHARRNNFKVLLSIKGVKSELAAIQGDVQSRGRRGHAARHLHGHEAPRRLLPAGGGRPGATLNRTRSTS